MTEQNGVAVIERQSATVAVPNGALAALTPEKRELLKRTIAKGATDDELELALTIAGTLGLDPFAKQIAFIKRWDRKEERHVMSIQPTIDGARLLAQRSAKYGGQIGPYWCGPDGQWVEVWLNSEPPAAAKVGVIHHDWKEPLYAVAKFSSYCQRNKAGQPTTLWVTMPDLMIAKCFSPDTEVLTDQGFQRFGEVTGRVLQVTDTGLATTSAKPFRQSYSGNMVTLDSDDLNFSVTPNHDMVTTEGKIEAGAMFANARSRAKHFIPRCVTGTKPDAPISDQAIQLAAAYLADGADRSGGRFIVEVSRPGKVAELRSIGGYSNEYERKAAGREAITAVRTITTTRDKMGFAYALEQIAPLCREGKLVNTEALLTLSRRQARLFVDTLVEFDGSRNKRSGVRRFYTSRKDHLEAFETAAVIGGYAVNRPRQRTSDISSKPNYSVTISGRSEIGVRRWGRDYHNLSSTRTGNRKHTGLEITQNLSGEVWCVTVPSGQIVVRRNGFSMICGNCAEMLALRRAFPAEFHHAYGGSEETGVSDAVNWGNVVEAEGTVSDAQVAQVVAVDETQNQPTRADINRFLHAVAEQRGVTHEQLTAMAVQFFGAAESLTEVSDENLARLANRIEKADDEALAATLALLNTPEDDDAADAEPVEMAGEVSADAVDELDSSATESDDIGGQIEQEFLDAIGRAWTPETLQEIAGRLRESGISTQALRDAYKVRSQQIAAHPLTQQRQAKSQPELVSVPAPERPIDERIPL